MSRIKLFILDMDGTFYLGNRILPGALEFVERAALSGRDFIFLTNNSSKSASDYSEKLSSMGLAAAKDKIITSGDATIDYLEKYHRGAPVYLMGNRSLAAEFANAGIALSENGPKTVVTAFDTELTYEKLCKVCGFVRSGLPWIATHPDYNCPTEDGFIPDIGSMHALITASTGRRPDITIGKPEEYIMRYALKRAGFAPSEAAMVGDRLYTDIAAAVSSGMAGILVLSGETTRADLETSLIKPDLVFDGLERMCGFI